jgi:hypothetical protein
LNTLSLCSSLSVRDQLEVICHVTLCVTFFRITLIIRAIYMYKLNELTLYSIFIDVPAV